MKADKRAEKREVYINEVSRGDNTTDSDGWKSKPRPATGEHKPERSVADRETNFDPPQLLKTKRYELVFFFFILTFLLIFSTPTVVRERGGSFNHGARGTTKQI